MIAVQHRACARCGQLPRSILPGPGHCTCVRDRAAEARRRVSAALVEIDVGRAAVLRTADLYHVAPELVANLLCHPRLAVMTTTLLYYRASEMAS